MTKLKSGAILWLAVGVSLPLAWPMLNQLVGATQQAEQGHKSKPGREEIGKLIAQLGSEEFKEREAAMKALEAVGQPALAALAKAAATSPDAELRRRAEALVQRIEDRLADVREFRAHKQGITQVCFSPDGSRFLSSSYEGTIKLWETKSGKELRQFQSKERGYLPDKGKEGDKGRGGGAKDKQDKGARNRTLQIVYRVGFSPDGWRAVSGGQEGHLCLWDLRSGKAIRYFPEQENLRIMALAISPDGRQLLSGGTDQNEQGELRLWDLDTGKEVRHLGHLKTAIFSTVFLSNDQALSAGRDGIIRFWDLKSGKEAHQFEGHGQAVTQVSVSAQGSTFLSSSWDQTIRLWDAKTRRELRRCLGHTDMVRSVKFTPNGKRALSASHDRTVRLWDLESGRQLRRFEGFPGQIADVDVTGDGRLVLSGDMDGMVRLWRLFREE
jgi:WD40 repeat protein